MSSSSSSSNTKDDDVNPTTGDTIAPIIIPWSKRHKNVTKSANGGLKYSLSNSFAQPLTMKELLDWSKIRNDYDLIKEYNEHSLEYTPNGGSFDLREEIAKLYESPNITPDNILVTSGGQVALQLVHKAILCCCNNSQKMHAITFKPGYQSVVEGPKLANARCSITQIQLKASEGWQIPLSKVEDAMKPDKTSLIVINEPYNPAGTLDTKETQSGLIELARKNEAYILCDEVYRLLEHDPSIRLPAMADAYDKGISVVTMSKPWGGCGITIGWIALQDLSLKEKIWNYQYFGTACMSRASEIQGIMVLRESDRILERNLQIIRSNKKLLENFIDDYQDLFEWVPPTAGAICAIRFKGPLTSEQLGDKLASEASIGMKPSYCFATTTTSDNNGGGGKVDPQQDYFRVGFGESKMPLALEKLREYVDLNKDNWRKEMPSVVDDE